jgi:hypothetical protein
MLGETRLRTETAALLPVTVLFSQMKTINSMKHFFLFHNPFSSSLFAQEIALVKYSGGGDWYANPTHCLI